MDIARKISVHGARGASTPPRAAQVERPAKPGLYDLAFVQQPPVMLSLFIIYSIVFRKLRRQVRQVDGEEISSGFFSATGLANPAKQKRTFLNYGIPKTGIFLNVECQFRQYHSIDSAY